MERYQKVMIIYGQELEKMKLKALVGKVGYVDNDIQQPKHGKYVTVAGLPISDNEWYIPQESIRYLA